MKVIHLFCLFKSVLPIICRISYVLSRLRKKGYYQIRPFKLKSWHDGYGYFKAEHSSGKVFIKVDTVFNFVENEKIFYECLLDKLAKNLIPLRDYLEGDDVQIVIFDCVEPTRELDLEYVLSNPEILLEVVFILKKIKAEGIIHRDIKLDNFMIVGDALKIIDFTFAQSLSNSGNFKELEIVTSNNLEILKNLGSPYKPEEFIWNDFISFKNVLEEMEISKISNDKELQNIILNISNELNSLSKDAYYYLSRS
ncbi:hypothetical protein AB4379_16095 [Vibrio breoganii]